jgi:predicted TPR repeat methyltransferase
MLAAMGGARTPERASDGYVRATFDDFAESFDRNLEELGYRAPQILFEAVTQSQALSRKQGLEILDLGCGTGLCGSLFRPVARRLVGVDLSPGMLSKAAIRAVYDQLNCGELTQWLSECGQRFDVAIAADVLCYFGELTTAFRNVRKVLQPGGLFACTLEKSTDEPAASSAERAPFILRPHGRYQHDAGYVEASLEESRLALVSMTTGVLRYERRDAVPGLVTIAQRRHTDADG